MANVGRAIDLSGRRELDVTDGIRKGQCRFNSILIIDFASM